MKRKPVNSHITLEGRKIIEERLNDGISVLGKCAEIRALLYEKSIDTLLINFLLLLTTIIRVLILQIALLKKLTVMRLVKT